MQQNITDKALSLSQNGYNFKVKEYINEAWETLKPHWLIVSAFTAVYIGVLFLLLRYPQVGQIIQMIITGPISAGYYLTIQKIYRNEPINFESFLQGFSIFLPTMILSMLIGLLVSFGFILLVVPAIFILLIYFFAMPLVVFEKLDFWPAMESSRVIIMARLKDAFILGIAIVGINILGILAFGIGVFFTIPLSYAIVYSAFKDIYEIEEEVEIEDKFNYFR